MAGIPMKSSRNGYFSSFLSHFWIFLDISDYFRVIRESGSGPETPTQANRELTNFVRNVTLPAFPRGELLVFLVFPEWFPRRFHWVSGVLSDSRNFDS